MHVNKTRRVGLGPPMQSSPSNPKALLMSLAAMMLLTFPVSSPAKTIITWDFSKGLQGWIGNSKVQNLSSSSEGLMVKSIGEDPWIEGPAVNLPGEGITRVKIRMKSNADAGAELFYGRTFKAGDSVRFTVRTDGLWHDYALVIRDKLGLGTRFRLDPCTGQGELTVASIAVETISEIALPTLEKPKGPDITTNPRLVKSGPLEFQHFEGGWGNFVLKVNGVQMAAGYESELIGVVLGERTEWLNLKNAKVTFDDHPEHNEFTISAIIEDSKGVTWNIRRRLKPGQIDGTIAITTELRVDKDRELVYVPWLTIFPGLGTFGQRKDQGLFAGLEYLCDEPSSSEADIETPDHVRRVPDPLKITLPLAAIAQGGNYIGIIWEPSDVVAATFDSPDTIYNSGAAVISLSGPGVGELRFENEFCAHTPLRLEANKPLKASALIIGGEGKSVVPAVKRYVALKGLPAGPEFEGGFSAAVDLLSHGWLDSQINHNGLFRHAVWGNNFPAGPAADAAMFIDWLAHQTPDTVLRERLDSAKEQALAQIPPAQSFSSCVSHAHVPTAPFVFGRTFEFIEQRREQAARLLGSFDETGVELYRPGKTDYSRTHFAKHANGLAGRDMVTILEGAALSGDKELAAKALELLDKLTALYADTVPRGAQTWEVPLHTPDILASAHMVKAYTLGYVLSEQDKYLEQARYWAWTGVPFVYLYQPTPGRVGPYATIAVLGATNWKAPLWIGQPVQWCGLVYASALHLLSEYDPKGPWEQIANGITATGLQMSWPRSDTERQGLLPDSFDLSVQIAAGPAINPGTVQAHVPELYGKGKLYDLKRLQRRGWFIHAPCAIRNIGEDADRVSFTTDGWGEGTYYIIISGIEKEPAQIAVRVVGDNSQQPPDFERAETQFHGEQRILVITLKGKSQIRVQ